ncbi:MAG TPA: hypothetical protein PKE12_15040 [Kiritimatiellia bacterium]|nr:hypothetical protein [Kiritimatiellia bacterium]
MSTPIADAPVIDSKRLIAINSASKYVTLVVGNLVVFFLTPYLIQTLGPLLLGLKTLAHQALQFVGLAHTAMGISYERYAKHSFARGDYNELNSNLSAGFLVSAISALLFAAGSVALAWWAGPLFSLTPELVAIARPVFLLIGISTAFLILTGVWETPAFVTERFYVQDVGHLICTLASAGLVVLAFEYGTPSIFVWVLLSNGALVAWRLFVMMPLARRLLPSFRIAPSLVKSSGAVWSMMAFGGLNFIGGIGFLLYYTSDSIIISNLPELGPEMIVFYNVAQRWDPQIRVLVMAFVGTLLPLMTAQVARQDFSALRSTFLRGTRYSLLIGIAPAVLLIAFAEPFLRHWVGADFARISAPVLQLIMLQFLLCIPERMAYNVNIAFARMKGPVFMALACGVLNIILSIALVRGAGWGLLGIAAGSVAALLIISIYSIGYALRLLDCPWRDWLTAGCLRPLFAALPLYGVALLVKGMWTPANLLDVFVIFAVCGIVYLPMAWGLGLNRDDRSEVGGILRRLWGRVTRRGADA